MKERKPPEVLLDHFGIRYVKKILRLDGVSTGRGIRVVRLLGRGFVERTVGGSLTVRTRSGPSRPSESNSTETMGTLL